MNQLIAALDGAWKVLMAGIILGAGLPGLFSLGVRQLALAADPQRPLGQRQLRRAFGITCFVVVTLAVLLGLAYIVAHGFGVKITFDGLLPHIAKK